MAQRPTFMLRDARTGQEYPISPSGLKIGRTSKNDIVLPADKVSRSHATLWSQGGQLLIRDEKSTNGTWVNGERISTSQPLEEGDQVRIGDAVFQVAKGAPSAAPVGRTRSAAGSSFPLAPVAIIGGVILVALIALMLRTPGGATGRATRTPTPAPTVTAAEGGAPTSTSTPRPRVNATRTPSSGSGSRAQAPTPVAPAQGREYTNPVAFQWQGSLSGSQAYQVTARHSESGYQTQSGMLTLSQWSTSLPAERFGEWRWTVSVVQGGQAVATSEEWMFWFQPLPGTRGAPQPTDTSQPARPTDTPTPGFRP